MVLAGIKPGRKKKMSPTPKLTPEQLALCVYAKEQWDLGAPVSADELKCLGEIRDTLGLSKAEGFTLGDLVDLISWAGLQVTESGPMN
jgi:hypothetical protein